MAAAAKKFEAGAINTSVRLTYYHKLILIIRFHLSFPQWQIFSSFSGNFLPSNTRFSLLVLTNQQGPTSPRNLEGIASPKAGAGAKSFTEKLDAEALKYFSEVAKRPFSQQAVAFLNAYWHETKNEAEFIYSYAPSLLLPSCLFLTLVLALRGR
jgi:hypothetical protein